MATYKIELHASTFPTGGGKHYFWILRDPSGKAIREMHGNNSDWVAGSSMPPGSLEFTENDLSENPPSMPGLTSPYQLNRPEGAPKPKFESFQIYFESPNLDEALKRWNAAKALGEYLNTKKIEYQLFSTNSNAMANTLGLAMGFKPTRLSFEGPYLAPGLDIDLTREYGKGAPKSPYRIGKPIPLLKGGSFEDDGRHKFAALRDVESRTDILRRPQVATMTPEAARRAIEATKADDAFSKRYVGNDRGAVDYMHALHRAAYPDTDTVVGPSVRPDANDSSADGMSLQARDTTSARQALEAAKSDNGFVKRYLDGDRNAFAQMQSLIRAAYPEPDTSGSGSPANGATAPIFQPWTPETATEGLAPWMQSSLKDYLSRSPDDEGDGASKLAPWMRDQYPDWLRGS